MNRFMIYWFKLILIKDLAWSFLKFTWQNPRETLRFLGRTLKILFRMLAIVFIKLATFFLERTARCLRRHNHVDNC